jgi:hypothetical protein
MEHNNELIRKLADCAAECEMCMDACLGEDDIQMLVQCIRLDRDCAKICHITSGFIASNSPFATEMVKLCEDICRKNAEECEKHDMDHCQRCAEACRECADACQSFVGRRVTEYNR